MNAKHTPAPWRVSHADKHGATVHAVACVAWCGEASSYSTTSGTTQHIDAAECAANARLIASAPELLRVCQMLADWWYAKGIEGTAETDEIAAAARRVLLSLEEKP